MQAAELQTQNAGKLCVGAGDAVLVNVWRNPISGNVTIRPDGKLSSPLVGDVVAAGLTPEQLSKLIRDKISIYVRTSSQRNCNFIGQLRFS